MGLFDLIWCYGTVEFVGEGFFFRRGFLWIHLEMGVDRSIRSRSDESVLDSLFGSSVPDTVDFDTFKGNLRLNDHIEIQSSGLKELQEATADISEDLKHFRIPKEFGSLELLCRIASADSVSYNNETNDSCKYWFHRFG
ncbi:unnamed protein product [Acanthocheilonema viteae]|uniref:Uncharacterized protein n=1 Tax=Acanthocheilonema viteae TaxID=6277 RepID=A0A498SWJ5_ACAVI|nr:unnamed protein product [Acanthocheilonema viteae]